MKKLLQSNHCYTFCEVDFKIECRLKHIFAKQGHIEENLSYMYSTQFKIKESIEKSVNIYFSGSVPTWQREGEWAGTLYL